MATRNDDYCSLKLICQFSKFPRVSCVAALTSEDATQDCLLTVRGESYTGKWNNVSLGECLPWSSPKIPYREFINYGLPVDHFPDHVDDLSELQNYCRLPFDFQRKTVTQWEMQRPWCFRQSPVDASLIITGCDGLPYCKGKYHLRSFYGRAKPARSDHCVLALFIRIYFFPFLVLIL